MVDAMWLRLHRRNACQHIDCVDVHMCLMHKDACMHPQHVVSLVAHAGRLQDLGGFKDWPFLEDYELVQRLRAEALPAIVPVPVFTSGRRWNKIGFVRTWAINQAILAGYHAGVHVESLARWYQEMKRS
eukprot:356114-Chlamydomonas_euryale.AAC.4